MTVDADERAGVFQVSKVEFEEHTTLNLSSSEDNGTGGGDSNGIVHEGAQEIDGDAKDDGSYVYVNEPDAVSEDFGEKTRDTESVVDQMGIVEEEAVVQEKSVSELNIGCPSGEKPVEVEKRDIDESCPQNGCIAEEDLVFSSAMDITVEGSKFEPIGDEIANNDTVEEQNNMVSDTEVQCNHESQITTMEDVESKLHQLDCKEKVVDQTELESSAVVESSAELEENQESLSTTMEDVESILHQLDHGEKVVEQTELESSALVESSVELEENQESLSTTMENVESILHQLDREEKVVERTELESLAVVESSVELEENQESLSTTVEDDESILHQLDCEEKVVEHTELESLAVVESSAELEGNQESQIAVRKGVEYELQQLDNEEKAEEVGNGEKNEEQSELDSATEVKEDQESQIMVREAVESELHQLHNLEEKVEELTKLGSSTEVVENQESQVTDTKLVEFESDQLDNGEERETKITDEIPIEDSSGGLREDQVPRSEAAICPVNIHLETEAVNGSDESGESLPTCIAEHIVTETEVINDSDEGHENMPTCPTVDIKLEYTNADGSAKNHESFPCLADDMKSETEVENITDKLGESLPAGSGDDMGSETEVRNPSVEISESFPVDGINMETKVENGSVARVDSIPTFCADVGKSEIEIGNGSFEGDNSIPTCSVEDVEIESEVMIGSVESARSLPTSHVNDVDMEPEVMNSSVESDIRLPTCPAADVELESEVGHRSGASDQNKPCADAEVQNISVENIETAPRCVNDVLNVENGGRESARADSDDKPICQEAEYIEGIQGDSSPQSSPVGSTADCLDEQKVDTEVDKKPFYFLIRSPRYVDNKLREQIRLAQLQVEERTQSRDAIRSTIQMKRATCNEYRDKFEATRSEERAARDALNAKRQEMDSVQSAISIEDIDERIHNMEHMIEHETMPLKEEKQLIREIKHLKHLREQLSSNVGRQDDFQQVSDQRDSIEERFKLLKQELDSLRKEVSQTEGITKAAKEKYFDENEKLRRLQAQFKAADDLRQEAYTQLQSLKKELYEKNKYFRMYKDELRAANDYVATGDGEALQHLCVNQVETIMELWNKNDEFRKEYIRCNIMSTLKRLRTLDGRSLGPDEEPTMIYNVVDERVDSSLLGLSKMSSALVNPPSESEQSFVLSGPEKDAKSMVKVEQKNLTAKSKKATKPTTLENGSVAASSMEEKEEAEEQIKKTKEEEELARKAEEMRKEEAAAKLKEQRRLEEKAKAKEAEERKRRNAEKAQARAELRAQKEAELKEKEREKKARKKQKKKAAAAETTNGDNEGESSPGPEDIPNETAQESKSKEKPTAVAKRHQKPSLLAKQTKTKALPPPLRNRGKRRMQGWMWVLASLLVLALFMVGNFVYSFKVGLPSFGF